MYRLREGLAGAVFAMLHLHSVLGGPSVMVSQGLLEGRHFSPVRGTPFMAFQGIPYAEPPLGELRFMPPKKLEKWEGVLNATSDARKCPQKHVIFDGQPHGSEDCLVLNVYTPRLKSEDGKKLAVMFWIHGGGFSSGSGSTELFGPENFMNENVILVTVNYRLGVLGFMSLEDELLPGNMGLKDIVMALEWVQENIHAFNGDKKEVTVFGNNAGGATVSMLLYSPMGEGLFTRAICQSGVHKLPQLFGENQKKRAFTLAKLLKKDASDPKEVLENLKKIDAFELVKAAPRTFDSTEVRDAQKSIIPFGPCIENNRNGTAFLTDFPDSMFKNKQYPNPSIPLMIGYNSKEAIVYLRSLINNPEILDKLNYNFQFSVPMRELRFKYNSQEYKRLATEIKKFYFKDGVIRNTSMNEFVDYVSDGVFYPVAKTLNQHLEMSDVPVYYYRFSFDGVLNYFKKAVMSDSASVKGASNGDEICYLFKCGKMEETYDQLHETEKIPEELILTKRIVRMWANFAKFGDPTPIEDPVLQGMTWIPAYYNHHHLLDINTNLTMETYPGVEKIAFWDKVFSNYVKTHKTVAPKEEL